MAETKLTAQETRQRRALERDIVRTINEIESYTVKRKYSFRKPNSPPDPKTYKEYVEEAKSPEYFINKYNKTSL